MGYFFSLSAEFGTHQTDAQNFAEHFHEISSVLSNGEQFYWKADICLESVQNPNRIDAQNYSEEIHKVCSMLSEMLSAREQSSQKLEPFIEAGYLGSNWWCSIHSKKADGSDVNVFEDSQQMNELAFLLYKCLKSAPPFRYALVGVEVDLFRTYDELFSDDLIKDEPEKFRGLVVSKEIWRRLGSPACFVNFREGYLWIPFRPLTDWIAGV